MGELSRGKRYAGGQKKRFKDSLKLSLKSLSIDVNSSKTLAQNRPEWRGGITSGARLAVERRKTEAQVKRVIRKNKDTITQAINTDHLCTIYGRAFLI
jgi:hypothetical protein